MPPSDLDVLWNAEVHMCGRCQDGTLCCDPDEQFGKPELPHTLWGENRLHLWVLQYFWGEATNTSTAASNRSGTISATNPFCRQGRRKLISIRGSTQKQRDTVSQKGQVYDSLEDFYNQIRAVCIVVKREGHGWPRVFAQINFCSKNFLEEGHSSKI